MLYREAGFCLWLCLLVRVFIETFFFSRCICLFAFVSGVFAAEQLLLTLCPPSSVRLYTCPPSSVRLYTQNKWRAAERIFMKLDIREFILNRLTPNDPYMGRTAPLTSKVAFYIFIQQIQVQNILNMLHTLRFFSLQNAVCFIMLTCLVPVLFTFYIQDVLKLKKNNSGSKGLIIQISK